MIPVDLFPQNPQFEMVILFERMSEEELRDWESKPKAELDTAATSELPEPTEEKFIKEEPMKEEISI